MIRPNPRLRMPGNAKRVKRMALKNMASNCACQTASDVSAAGPGGGPHVEAFSGLDGSLLANFFAYDPGFTGGLRVGAVDANGDGRADIVTGPGPGGGPQIRIRDALSLADLDSFFAFDAAFAGGIFVAGVR